MQRVLFRAGLTLATLLMCGLSASAADVQGLQDQLETELRARRPVEIAFLERVVGMVERDELPFSLVRSTMLWARTRQPRPFPYFQRALVRRAAQHGIEIE